MVNRRSASWIACILLAVTTVAGFISPATVSAVPADSASTPSAAAVTARAAVDDPVGDDVPVDTANPFLPDQRDLTDCIGLVERPGCGSEARGGLHQNLVAIVMTVGLLLVFGRVAWGVRRSQKRRDPNPESRA